MTIATCGTCGGSGQWTPFIVPCPACFGDNIPENSRPDLEFIAMEYWSPKTMEHYANFNKKGHDCVVCRGSGELVDNDITPAPIEDPYSGPLCWVCHGSGIISDEFSDDPPVQEPLATSSVTSEMNPGKAKWDQPGLPSRLNYLAKFLDGKDWVQHSAIHIKFNFYISNLAHDYQKQKAGNFAYLWIQRWIEIDKDRRCARLRSTPKSLPSDEKINKIDT